MCSALNSVIAPIFLVGWTPQLLTAALVFQLNVTVIWCDLAGGWWISPFGQASYTPLKPGEQISAFVGDCSIQPPTLTEKFSGLVSVWFKLVLFLLFVSWHCWHSCSGRRRWDKSLTPTSIVFVRARKPWWNKPYQASGDCSPCAGGLWHSLSAQQQEKHCDIQGVHCYACKIFSIMYSLAYKCQANNNNNNISTAFRYWSFNLPCKENNNYCKEYWRLQLNLRSLPATATD